MPESESQDPRERVRVLLVEDSRWDAEVLREFLRESPRYHFSMEWAITLADGLRRLESGEVDVVMVDLLLPDSFGLDTIDKVHRAAPEVALVVYSSIEDEAYERDVLDRGALVYLAKNRLRPAPEGQVNHVVRCMEYALEKSRLRSLTSRRDPPDA